MPWPDFQKRPEKSGQLAGFSPPESGQAVDAKANKHRIETVSAFFFVSFGVLTRTSAALPKRD